MFPVYVAFRMKKPVFMAGLFLFRVMSTTSVLVGTKPHSAADGMTLRDISLKFFARGACRRFREKRGRIIICLSFFEIEGANAAREVARKSEKIAPGLEIKPTN